MPLRRRPMANNEPFIFRRGFGAGPRIVIAGGEGVVAANFMAVLVAHALLKRPSVACVRDGRVADAFRSAPVIVGVTAGIFPYTAFIKLARRRAQVIAPASPRGGGPRFLESAFGRRAGPRWKEFLDERLSVGGDMRKDGIQWIGVLPF